MTKWSKVINKEGRKPVANTSLALLVRALRAHPEACPVPKMASAHDVLNQIELTSRTEQDRPLAVDKKRLAIMFGCEASSGYRWITVGSKISPVLARLFTVFKGRHGEALSKARADSLRQNKSTSGRSRIGVPADALMLNEWDAMVTQEAHVRGIEGIFSIGRWVPQQNTSDATDA